MTDLQRRYNLYHSTIRRFLLMNGLWPFANPSVRYRLLLAAHAFSMLAMIGLLVNFCLHHSANLALFLKGLGTTVSFMTILVKTSCMMIYRDRLVDLHTVLGDVFSEDFTDPEMRPLLLSPLPTFYGPSLLVGIFTYMVIGIQWFTPPIIMAIERSRGVGMKYRLPFPTFYPWEISSGSWRYPVHYAFEMYTGFCLGSFSIAIDSLFGYYVFQISGELRALSARLSSVKCTDNYEQIVRDCVTRHRILIRCQRSLECIYGPMIVWMLVTNSIIMVAFIYQVAHMTSLGTIILAVVYISMKSMQILFYGIFGSFLGTENEKLREAIYSTDWPGSGEKCFMTDVLIMITYPPLFLRACSLATVSVDMFVAVAHTSLSYFFMLRTLEEGNET